MNLEIVLTFQTVIRRGCLTESFMTMSTKTQQARSSMKNDIAHLIAWRLLMPFNREKGHPAVCDHSFDSLAPLWTANLTVFLNRESPPSTRTFAMILTRRVLFNTVTTKCGEIFDNLALCTVDDVQTYVCLVSLLFMAQ